MTAAELIHMITTTQRDLEDIFKRRYTTSLEIVTQSGEAISDIVAMQARQNPITQEIVLMLITEPRKA